jgi:2-iminobutanoate/2-iminopropanoate deaminase
MDCATLMMIVSDNVATDLLLDAIGGPATVRAVMERLGCGDVAVTSPTVWALPPEQFGMASPRGLAEAWTPLDGAGALADRCRRITWRHQHREGFARHVPFSPDLPDFGMTSALRLWSKSGSYPSVSCEAGLFETDHARWVLAVMADEVRDRRSGSTGAGPTLRAEVSRIVFDAWAADRGECAAMVTAGAPPPQGPYRASVRAGDTLYVSGQLGRRDGVLLDGFEAQARQALANLAAVLADHDAGVARVVKVTVFLDDIGDWAAFNGPFAEVFGTEAPPARTVVAVEALPGGGLVELHAVAWLG